MQKTAIITGITGQDGAYLSALLLSKNYRVIGLIRKNAKVNLFGLHYLGLVDRVILVECDLLDKSDIERVFQTFLPSEVYNLAAQSSVGISFEQPTETMQFNIFSVINLLEVIRRQSKAIRFYQASSSDMFGNIDNLPVTEMSVIHPTSPYGISKATGHWMTINYRESYNLYACCGILFNHESYLRTPNFYVKKVIQSALAIKNGKKQELRVGNIDLRRDFGYAPDYVKAMWMMLQQKTPKEYIICSGSSLSLRAIAEYVFKKLGLNTDKIVVDESFFRPNDIMNIYGSNEKAKSELGWKYDKTFFEVLDILLHEELTAAKMQYSVS